MLAVFRSYRALRLGQHNPVTLVNSLMLDFYRLISPQYCIANSNSFEIDENKQVENNSVVNL